MKVRIKRALISVSNKEGIVDFAKTLEETGVEIISTGGTYRKLEESGIKVKKVEEVTDFPEMLNGRVKTLHPYIHGGILKLKDKVNRYGGSESIPIQRNHIQSKCYYGRGY